jgi:hypothetical protein
MKMDVSHEMQGVNLLDSRLNRRAARLVRTIARHPAAGFPSVFDSESGLEAFYRFVNNDAVSPDRLLAPHAGEAWRRAASDPGPVLVLHDTSEFTFKGETPRQGLVQKDASQGFYGHFALAVALNEAPLVHGVVGHRSYVVEDGLWVETQGKKGDEVELLVGSERWSDLVKEVRASPPPNQQLIHVMDREADDYVLWTNIVDQGDDFVIRARHDRRVAEAHMKSFEQVGAEPFVVSREVNLSRRGKRRPVTSQGVVYERLPVEGG